MTFEPPLLVIAPIRDGFDLAHMPWSETAKERISVNSAKFDGLDMIEIIFDSMPFLLTFHTATETKKRFSDERFEALFCGPPTSYESAIAITPRDILTSGRHLPEVNHRTLLLGKWVGDSLSAISAAWIPSRRIASFAFFREVVADYLTGGPFPVTFQTSFSEVRQGCYVTKGLNYFSGQEIRLTTPPDYSASDISERLVRIIDDITTHGAIDAPSRAKGMIDGETLTFSTGDDREYLDIIIENHATTTG